MDQYLQTSTWDNSNFYRSFQDPKLTQDITAATQNIDRLNQKSAYFDAMILTFEVKPDTQLIETIPLAREMSRLKIDTQMTLWTMLVYGTTASSVDSKDLHAVQLTGQINQLIANLKKASKSLDIFLMRVPQNYLNEFLKDLSVNEMAFRLSHNKRMEKFLLSTPEETLIEGLAIDGFNAWSNLYNELSGTLQTTIQGETMGLAKASNILFTEDRKHREAAYVAINKTWQENEVTSAAIINSLYGWRTELNKTRSKKQELHYLDESCHEQRITRQTLNTLMETTYQNRHTGQEAIRLMAKETGLTKLAPWDLLAAYPAEKTKKLSFPEAMNIVIEAFGEFDSEMAEFAKMMMDKKWIDSTPTPRRKTGAYCTSFAKTSEPRVFLTFDGNMKNVMTLAHELGHAYHTWIIRDLAFTERLYPSTLAETASIFAETLVREALIKKATTSSEKKKILWQELDSASTLLVNIPARFKFEVDMMELRQKKSITAAEMKDLTRKAWSHWYEDTLTEPNEMFWASKLHFSMSKVSFYNYPYLFGYLFSLGIYAKKNEYGTRFKKLYIDILRDTGRMTAEDLIKNHFNDDITKPEFWQKSLNIVESNVRAFKELS